MSVDKGIVFENCFRKTGVTFAHDTVQRGITKKAGLLRFARV